MINILKRAALILIFTFIGSFTFLNFDFLYSQISWPLDNKEMGEITDPLVQPRLFPASSDRNLLKIEAALASSKISSTQAGVPIKSKINLEIPTLGIKAPIIFEPTTNEDRIYKSLERGVVHYSATPQPGSLGTSIIIAHSSVYPWYNGNYGYVFSNLSKLKNGDIVNVDKEGQLLTYRVSQSIIFSPSSPDDFALRELETTDGSALVLMTCWPTGTNSKRVAIRA